MINACNQPSACLLLMCIAVACACTLVVNRARREKWEKVVVNQMVNHQELRQVAFEAITGIRVFYSEKDQQG